MSIEVYAVEARPDDVLYVRGAVDGVPVEAAGWQSALTHHYGAEAYQDDGHLAAGANPRTMTADEAQAYVEALLATAAGHAVVGAADGITKEAHALIGSVQLAPEPEPEPEPEPAA